MAVLQLHGLGAGPLWPLSLCETPPLAGTSVAVLGYPLFSPASGLRPSATAGCIAQARIGFMADPQGHIHDFPTFTQSFLPEKVCTNR